MSGVKGGEKPRSACPLIGAGAVRLVEGVRSEDLAPATRGERDPGQAPGACLGCGAESPAKDVHFYITIKAVRYDRSRHFFMKKNKRRLT